MFHFLLDPWHAPYMRRALIEMGVLAILAGTVSVYVLLRRLAFIGDALTHSVFPGVVVAFVLGQSLFLGALVAGVVAAVLVTAVTRSRRIDDDAALGVVLATMFALGVVVVSHQRSYASDLTALAFGRILSVDTAEIIVSAAVAVVVLAVLATLHKELVLRAFDPVATEALGYRVGALDLVLNLAIALVVVAAVKAVGTVLVVALIVVPGATARLLTDRLARMVVIACAITALCGWVGLATSYDISLHHGVGVASGATVVVALTVAFAGAALVSLFMTRRARLAPAP